MIEFRPIRIDDRTAIERYTLPAGIANCDLAFANMFCWQFVYRSAWAEVDGFLVIRFHIDGGPRIGYMQPVGPGDFTALLPRLEEDARAHGERLRLVGLTDEARALLRSREPGAFAFDSDRAAEDYLYAASDLRELPGRRFQAKRNHINRFVAEYPDYRYEELTPDRFAECMTLEREWRRNHEGGAAGLCAEQYAMQRAFDHFEALGLRGGCIYVGGRLVAFTYGSALTEDTFDTHVEKADTHYDGAFTIINRLFAERLPERFTRINREEDLGIEGLRRAKLSYRPEALQRKFRAIRLRPDEAACKRLWMTCFDDDEEFVDAFLIRHYDAGLMLAATEEGALRAMLHLLPFTCETGRTVYIYGVATDPAFRERGLASRLLREALRRIDAAGIGTALLIPAAGSPRLRDFYARFGFEGAVPVTFETPDRFDFGTGDPAADRAMVRRRGTHDALPDRLHLVSASAPELRSDDPSVAAIRHADAAPKVPALH